MRGRTIYLVFTLCSLVGFSQTIFLPNIGTKWNYTFINSGYYAVDNNPIEYVKDSVYNGEIIKILTSNRMSIYCSGPIPTRIFIRQKNDSVWFLHSVTNQTWQLLIDYNAQPGQSWSYTTFTNSNILNTHTVTVNSVGSVQLNNLSLKTLSVTYTGSNVGFNTVIYERFGTKLFLFPISTYSSGTYSCDYYNIGSLLCYTDGTFGSTQFTGYPCDFINLSQINEFNKVGNTMRISPNPCSGKLQLEFENNLNSHNRINVINSLGKLVISNKSLEVFTKEVELDVSELQNGIYFLQVYGGSKLMASGKFVKE